jgi:hypothetical protein
MRWLARRLEGDGRNSLVVEPDGVPAQAFPQDRPPGMAVDDLPPTPIRQSADVAIGTVELHALLCSYSDTLTRIEKSPALLWDRPHRSPILCWLRLPAPRALVRSLLTRHISRHVSALRRCAARRVVLTNEAGTFRAIASTGPAPVRSCSPSELTDQLSAIVCKRSCTQVPARPTRSRCTTPARRQPRSAGQPECALARRNRSVRRRWFVGCRSLPVYSLCGSVAGCNATASAPEKKCREAKTPPGQRGG